MSAEEAKAVDRPRRKRENYEHLGSIRLQVAVELGRKVMSLKEADELRQGDIIELDKLAGEPFDVRINDHLFAQGETVVITDIMSCRLTRIMSP